MVILDQDILIHIFRYIQNEFDLMNIISLFPSIETVLWKKKCIDKFLLYNTLQNKNKFKFLKKINKDHYNSLIKLPNECFFPVINFYDFIKIENNVFYFTGEFKGGNRCIRGNLPYLLYNKPFCSFIKNKNNLLLLPLLVYYYEIFIIETEEKWSNPCISIGMCSDDFPLLGLQLGWDKYSYGLHSDDGKIYFNNLSENFTIPFESGNYIGCGLFFNGKGYDLFYTKNGNFLGYAFKNIKGRRFYPAIGIDCKNKIKINFGLNNFEFNFMKINNLAIENYKIQNNLKKIDLNTRVISFYRENNKYKLLNILLNRNINQINSIRKYDFEKIISNIILSINSNNTFNSVSFNISLMNFLNGPIYFYENIEESITADSDDEMI